MAMDELGNGILHYLSYNNSADELTQALEDGANVHHVNVNLETALHWASRMDCEEAVKILLSHGINVDAKDISGSTALHYAVECGSNKVIPLLIQAGCNHLISDNDDCTPVEIVESKSMDTDGDSFAATRMLCEKLFLSSVTSDTLALGSEHDSEEKKNDTILKLSQSAMSNKLSSVKSKLELKNNSKIVPPKLVLHIEELESWKKERRQILESKKKSKSAPFICGIVPVSIAGSVAYSSSPMNATSARLKSPKVVSEMLNITGNDEDRPETTTAAGGSGGVAPNDTDELNNTLMSILSEKMQPVAVAKDVNEKEEKKKTTNNKSSFSLFETNNNLEKTAEFESSPEKKQKNWENSFNTVMPQPKLRKPCIWAKIVPFSTAALTKSEKISLARSTEKKLAKEKIPSFAMTTSRPKTPIASLGATSATTGAETLGTLEPLQLDSVPAAPEGGIKTKESFKKGQQRAPHQQTAGHNNKTDSCGCEKAKLKENHEPPTQFVPFLPSGWLSRCLDVVVTVEHCFDCEDHRWFSWHDEDKYDQRANQALNAILQSIAESGFPVRVFAFKVKSDHSRLAAFEVTISVRLTEISSIEEDLELLRTEAPNGDSIVPNLSPVKQKRHRLKHLRGKHWVSKNLHSKLETSSWPSTRSLKQKTVYFLSSLLFGKEFAEVYTAFSSKKKKKLRAFSPTKTAPPSASYKDKRQVVIVKSWQQQRKEALSRGDVCPKIEGNYLNEGRWLVASIILERVDGTFDLVYDSGKLEKRVPVKRIRKIEVISDIDSAFLAYVGEETEDSLVLDAPSTLLKDPPPSSTGKELDGHEEDIEDGYDGDECCGGVGQDVMLSYFRWKEKTFGPQTNNLQYKSTLESFLESSRPTTPTSPNHRSPSPTGSTKGLRSTMPSGIPPMLKKDLAVLDSLINPKQKAYLLECVSLWNKRMNSSSGILSQADMMAPLLKPSATVAAMLSPVTPAPTATTATAPTPAPATTAASAPSIAVAPVMKPVQLPSYLDFSAAPSIPSILRDSIVVPKPSSVIASQNNLSLLTNNNSNSNLHSNGRTSPENTVSTPKAGTTVTVVSPPQAEKSVAPAVADAPGIVIQLFDEAKPSLGVFLDPSSVLFSSMTIPGNLRFGPGTMEASLQFAPPPTSSSPTKFVVTNLRSSHGNVVGHGNPFLTDKDMALDASEIQLPFVSIPLAPAEMDAEQMRLLYHFFVFDNTPTAEIDYTPPIPVKFAGYGSLIDDNPGNRPRPPKASASDVPDEVSEKKMSSKSQSQAQIEVREEGDEDDEGNENDEEDEFEAQQYQQQGMHPSNPYYGYNSGPGGVGTSVGGMHQYQPQSWGAQSDSHYSYNRDNMMAYGQFSRPPQQDYSNPSNLYNSSYGQPPRGFDSSGMGMGLQSVHQNYGFNPYNTAPPNDLNSFGGLPPYGNFAATAGSYGHIPGPADWRGASRENSNQLRRDLSNQFSRGNSAQLKRDNSGSHLQEGSQSIQRELSNSNKSRGGVLAPLDANPQNVGADEAKRQFVQARAKAFHQALSGKSNSSTDEKGHFISSGNRGVQPPAKSTGIAPKLRATIRASHLQEPNMVSGIAGPSNSSRDTTPIRGTFSRPLNRSRQSAAVIPLAGTNRPGTAISPVPLAFGRRTVNRPVSAPVQGKSSKGITNTTSRENNSPDAGNRDHSPDTSHRNASMSMIAEETSEERSNTRNRSSVNKAADSKNHNQTNESGHIPNNLTTMTNLNTTRIVEERSESPSASQLSSPSRRPSLGEMPSTELSLGKEPPVSFRRSTSLERTVTDKQGNQVRASLTNANARATLVVLPNNQSQPPDTTTASPLRTARKSATTS